MADEAQEEVQAYLQSSFSTSLDGQLDALNWWEQNKECFPKLFRISLRYLCVPATNAAAEGEFSLSRYLISEKRTNLSAENVNNLLFLKNYFDNTSKTI